MACYNVLVLTSEEWCRIRDVLIGDRGKRFHDVLDSCWQNNNKMEVWFDTRANMEAAKALSKEGQSEVP